MCMWWLMVLRFVCAAEDGNGDILDSFALYHRLCACLYILRKDAAISENGFNLKINKSVFLSYNIQRNENWKPARKKENERKSLIQWKIPEEIVNSTNRFVFGCILHILIQIKLAPNLLYIYHSVYSNHGVKFIEV